MTNDMSPVIVPKSDQISADDFLAGPMTYVIEAVEIRPGTEQPVSIFLAGEKRPWKPCKSMARVLVFAWGPDANAYKGRSVTLFRDPTVKWGGVDVGGIRISHMSHIKGDLTVSLTATKGKRAPFKVRLIQEAKRAPQTESKPDEFDIKAWATELRANLPKYTTAEKLHADYAEHCGELSPAARDFMDNAVNARIEEIAALDEIPD